MTMNTVSSPTPSRGYGADRQWLAKLDLKLVPTGTKTHLKQLAFVGPLRIQRPFYPEGGVCHLYVLHPPGGLVSGDRLNINVHGAADSQTLLTTPSAGKVYGRDSDGVVQGQSVQLTLEKNAQCEWLPQETIIYSDAHAVLDTSIELEAGARFIGWDLVCLGRPASDARFSKGSLSQRIRLSYEGRLLFNEHLQLVADSSLHRSRVGLYNQSTFGTLVAYGIDFGSELITSLRADLDGSAFTVTQRLGVLLVRYLGEDMNECRAGMWRAWALIRPPLLERPACTPRIWLT